MCGPRVWSDYRAGIQEAIHAWRLLGGRVIFVTLTVPHSHTDDLQSLLNLLAGCWTRVWSGRPGRRLRGEHGIAGIVRVLEVRDGAHGWHPHYHALLFVPDSAEVLAVGALTKELGQRWAKACAEMGRSITPGGLDYLLHAKRLVNPHLHVADYLTKGPGLLIADLAHRVLSGDRRARARWRELQAALTGRTRVLRTPGVAVFVARAVRLGRRRPHRWPDFRLRDPGPDPFWRVTPRCRSPPRGPL